MVVGCWLSFRVVSCCLLLCVDCCVFVVSGLLLHRIDFRCAFLFVVVGWMLFVVVCCCWLLVVRCSLFVVRWLLFDCWLLVVC